MTTLALGFTVAWVAVAVYLARLEFVNRELAHRLDHLQRQKGSAQPGHEHARAA